MNKRLCKQSWGWWFETLSWSLWRHGNVLLLLLFIICLHVNVFFSLSLHWRTRVVTCIGVIDGTRAIIMTALITFGLGCWHTQLAMLLHSEGSEFDPQIAEMPNLSPLSASSDLDGDGIVGVTVDLRLSAQSTGNSRYLTMYSLQRTQRGHPTALPKGRGVVCLFWVLSLSLSELSLSSFSCCFQYHLIFDCDISIVYGIHVLVFLYLVDSSISYASLSALPPEMNCIQIVNYIMYFCWVNKTLVLEDDVRYMRFPGSEHQNLTTISTQQNLYHIGLYVIYLC